MTQAEVDNHREVSDTFLQQAIAEFEAGDLLQASEKAWGTVAHYLKSVAKFRGWPNRTHSDLTEIADDLGYETDDLNRMRDLYFSAGQMHQNFYEDTLSHGQVSRGVDNAREFIDRLENRTGLPLNPRPSQVSRRRRRSRDQS